MTTGRIAAAEILVQVLRHRRSLRDSLPPRLARVDTPRERAFARDLCYGVLRWLPRLAAMLETLLARPLRPRERDVYAVLLLGLYQLEYTRVPPHAAVAETVDLLERLGKPWARGLVNGVLRTFLRERAALRRRIDRRREARFAHPEWLIDLIARAWPSRWQEILEANNRRAPMSLRVNRLRIDRERYRRRLRSRGLDARPARHVPEGLILAEAVDVARLPGFFDGLVSVQDPAAQLAAALVDAAPGERTLDACAAPGGKTAHLLERASGSGQVVALDRDPARLARLRETLARVGVSAGVVCGDARAPDTWWDGIPFDHILLDAPCSAAGVIRRHPDIKYLRRAADIEPLEENQAAMLDALWPLLARSGTLVYATCSVLPGENAQQILRFLERHPDAEPRPIRQPWGIAASTGHQILPGEDDMDGFFYAILEKR